MEISKKRIDWVDCCKGFATILVVIGHICDGYLKADYFPDYSGIMQLIYNIVYSFHMPLFFALSGYVFYLAYCKNIDAKKRKFHLQIFNLIWIYILMCCVQWVFKMIFSSDVNTTNNVTDLLLIPIKPIAPYWYLYNLIFYYLIFYYLEKVRIDERIKLAAVAAVSIIGCFINIDIIFPISSIMKYMIFFYAGLLLSKYNFSAETVRSKKVLSIVTAALTAGIFALIIYLNINLLKVKIAGIIAALIIILCIIGIFAVTNCKTKILRLIGTYSLEVYIIHSIITAGNRKILSSLGVTNFYLNFGINFIAAVFIPILLAFILKKLKLHKLLLRPFSYFSDRRKIKEK